MNKGQIKKALETGDFGASGQLIKTSAGYLLGFGTTVGNGLENWAPGAIFIDLDAAADAQININEGTAATASWEALTVSAG